MKHRLQSEFQTRQHMLSEDFELYFYSDRSLAPVEWHSHDYYEFYFFLEGDVDIQAGEQSFSMEEGDILMIPPALLHRPVIHSFRAPYRRFVFWISQAYFAGLRRLSDAYVYLMDSQSAGAYRFHTDRITCNEFQSRMLQLLEEMQTADFGRDARIPLLVNDLILHINRTVYRMRHPLAPAADPALCRKIALFIEEHLEEDLSLARLSKEFYASRYYIAHLFKDSLGMSVHQYITKKRLARCRQAIVGAKSITEVYEAFGFGDYSSFYRAFKKEYGVSPKDYRDRMRLHMEP